MARTSKQFGEAVTAKLNDKGWSLRATTVATGIDYNTVSNMKAGIVPSMGKVIEWARGIRENINYWLELAGYEPIALESIEPESDKESILLRLKTSEGKLSESDLQEIKSEIDEILEHRRQG